MGSSLQSWIQEAKLGMETSVLPCKEKNQESTFCRIDYANHFLEFQRAYFGTFSEKREYNQQCMVLWCASQPPKACNSYQTLRITVKEGFAAAWQCTPTYCQSKYWNCKQTGFWGAAASCTQPRSCFFRLYHLFAPLKDALLGRKFSSDEAVQKAGHEWLCDQPKTFFSDGIHKLVDRWNKCIGMGGDYVEKWFTFFFTFVFSQIKKNNKSADNFWLALVYACEKSNTPMWTF